MKTITFLTSNAYGSKIRIADTFLDEKHLLILYYLSFDSLPPFYPYIKPGWFDKRLPGRATKGELLDRVVLICPSPLFVQCLPHGRIPDRSDFNYKNRISRAVPNPPAKPITKAATILIIIF